MGPLRRAAALLLVLILVQSACAVRRRLASEPQRRIAFATPNYTLYHRQDDLLREVANIVKANPGFMKLEVMTEADGDYKADVKVVTVEPGGFSDRVQDKVRILVDFGEHGRELVSSELGLLFLATLADPHALQRIFPESNRAGELQRLLQGTVIKVLPMENEGGRRMVESGQLCERKNGRGVDPNRNWLVDWGKKEPDYDPAEEYPGTKPFSEPEVRVVRRVATDFSPHVWLNIHSGMEAMLAPWDHKAEIAVEAKPTVDIMQRIHADVMVNTSCVVGSGGKSVGYLAHGTATDYMFEVLHVPVASTWEIFGDFDAHVDDCFRMFNPLTEEGLKDVLQRWLKAILRLIELLPTHPALQNSKAWSLESTSSAGSTSTAAAGGGAATDGGAAAKGGGTAAAAGGSAGGGAAATAKTSGITISEGSSAKAGSASQKGAEETAEEQGQGQRGEESSAGSSGGGTASGGGKTSQQAQQQEQHPEQQQQGQGQQSGGEDDAPRFTVVASQRGWGSGWGSEVFSGLLAVGGLAVVGILAFRCLVRTSSDRRRLRGEGYQAV